MSTSSGGIPTLKLDVPSLFHGTPQGAEEVKAFNNRGRHTTYTGVLRSVGEEAQLTFWGAKRGTTHGCRKVSESVLPLGAGPRLTCCNRLCCATPPSLTTTPSPDWARPTQDHLPSINSRSTAKSTNCAHCQVMDPDPGGGIPS